jgi:hypothetical protein
MVKMAGYAARIGEKKITYRILMEKPEGKRPLGIPRRRWDVDIQVNLERTGNGDVGWIHLGQDRQSVRTVVNAVMKLPVA